MWAWGTVSRVINGSASVSEATRQRVLDVVVELGYEPNATSPRALDGPHPLHRRHRPLLHPPPGDERLRGVALLLGPFGY